MASSDKSPAAPVASPQAAKSAASELTVPPVKRPRLSEAESAASPPALPTIPKDVSAPARGVMSKLIPWTSYRLKEFLKAHAEHFPSFPDVAIYMHQPLDIKGTTASRQELRSYKAPWNAGACLRAVEDTQMYEAAAKRGVDTPIPGLIDRGDSCR